MSIEAMKQALEALEESGLRWPNIIEAITSLHQAIAEAEKQDKFCDNNCVWTDHHPDCVRSEQKPVVEVRLVAGGKPMFLMFAPSKSFKDGDLLYSTPQQRTWLELTEQELVELRARVQEYTPIDSVKYGEAIQRAMNNALKEKNHDHRS